MTSPRLPIDGILCVDKPEGFTSFDVVAKLRGMLRTKKVGHAGTLDPMATGVLPIFVGSATRACDLMPEEDKTYVAVMQLGIVTDTQDRTGKILEQHPFSQITPAEVARVLPQFIGDLFQVPPMYSAIKIGGQKLYDLARQGKEIERPARPIQVKSIRLLSVQENQGCYGLEIHCSKGTYIRTLCHDMGAALGCGGMVTELRRIQSGRFRLENAVSLTQVQQLINSGQPLPFLPVEQAFEAYPPIGLDSRLARLWSNGVKLSLSQFSFPFPDGLLRIYAPGERFLGLGYVDWEAQALRVKKQFFPLFICIS